MLVFLLSFGVSFPNGAGLGRRSPASSLFELPPPPTPAIIWFFCFRIVDFSFFARTGRGADSTAPPTAPHLPPTLLSTPPPRTDGIENFLVDEGFDFLSATPIA